LEVTDEMPFNCHLIFSAVRTEPSGAALLFTLCVSRPQCDQAVLGLTVASAESQLSHWLAGNFQSRKNLRTTEIHVALDLSVATAECPVLTSDSSASRIWPVLSSWLAF